MQGICMPNRTGRKWHWTIALAITDRVCMLNTLYHDAKRLWTHCCHRLLSSFIAIRYNFYGAHKSSKTHLMWLPTSGGHCFDYQNTVLLLHWLHSPFHLIFFFFSPCNVIFLASWCDAVLQHMILSHLPWVHGARKSCDAISSLDGRWYVSLCQWIVLIAFVGALKPNSSSTHHSNCKVICVGLSPPETAVKCVRLNANARQFQGIGCLACVWVAFFKYLLAHVMSVCHQQMEIFTHSTQHN